MKNITNTLHERNKKKFLKIQEMKDETMMRVNMVKNKLDLNLDKAEERRKASI